MLAMTRRYLLAGAALAAVVRPALTAAQAGPVAPPPTSPGWTPVKLIDFSPKHDVLIQNEDGTLTPMDEPYYRSTQIAPGTWQVRSDGDYHYLVEGDTEALAIDTGYGAGNLREYLQTLTDKSVRFVANTHYHFDHTANCAYFDGAYQSAETAEKATIPYPSFEGIAFPRDYPRTILEEGDVIDVGGRTLEVLLIPNHTPGGTAFLDRRGRILFGGDEFMGLTPRPLNVSVAQFAENMRKVVAVRGAFDTIAAGPGIYDATLADKYLGAAEAILAGEEGQPVAESSGGPPATATPDVPEGTTVYVRGRVRDPDRGAPSDTDPAQMRVMTFEDVEITYDLENIEG